MGNTFEVSWIWEAKPHIYLCGTKQLLQSREDVK